MCVCVCVCVCARVYVLVYACVCDISPCAFYVCQILLIPEVPFVRKKTLENPQKSNLFSFSTVDFYLQLRGIVRNGRHTRTHIYNSSCGEWWHEQNTHTHTHTHTCIHTHTHLQQHWRRRVARMTHTHIYIHTHTHTHAHTHTHTHAHAHTHTQLSFHVRNVCTHTHTL